MKKHQHNTKNDYIGIVSSSLCLIHCLAAPLFLIFGMPFIETDTWHIWDFVFLGISAWAVFNASKGHTTALIRNGLWISFTVLTIAIILQHSHTAFLVLSWTAAAGLIFFHVLNLRHCQTCKVAS